MNHKNVLRNVKYFKGLDALRFFAAYLVVLHHSEHIRMKYGLLNLKQFSIFNNGGIAVTFFFVLSGFLISFLLLKEFGKTQTISVRKFYLRRVLRIWPLYFFLIIIGSIILPYILHLFGSDYIFPYNFKDVFFYYLFFSPFMVNIFYGNHLLEPLWSIGVEEIFYLLWAPLFKFFRKYLLSIILSVVIIRVIIMYYSHIGFLSPLIDRLVSMLRFEAMAIGSLGAYFIFNYGNYLSHFIFSRISQFFLIIFVLLRLIFFQFLVDNSMIFNILFKTPIISQLLFMIIFTWLIINISVNSRSIIKLDSKILNFLGNISYGVYMYHMLVVFFIIFFFKDYLLELDIVYSSLFFHSLLLTCVILISYLSKVFFENYFLRFKNKYRIVN
jgi:peptidoglycan/LPS O-acetylase OafA/YrhL